MKSKDLCIVHSHIHGPRAILGEDLRPGQKLWHQAKITFPEEVSFETLNELVDAGFINFVKPGTKPEKTSIPKQIENVLPKGSSISFLKKLRKENIISFEEMFDVESFQETNTARGMGRRVQLKSN